MIVGFDDNQDSLFDYLNIKENSIYDLTNELSIFLLSLKEGTRLWQLWNYGCSRRVFLLCSSIDQIFKEYPTSIIGKGPELDDEKSNIVSIHYLAFIINTAGLIDGLGHVINEAFHLNLSAKEVNAFDDSFIKIVRDKDASISELLKQAKKWNKQYLKPYRDAIAHRVTPYPVGIDINPDESNDLQREYFSNMYIYLSEEERKKKRIEMRKNIFNSGYMYLDDPVQNEYRRVCLHFHILGNYYYVMKLVTQVMERLCLYCIDNRSESINRSIDFNKRVEEKEEAKKLKYYLSSMNSNCYNSCRLENINGINEALKQWQIPQRAAVLINDAIAVKGLELLKMSTLKRVQIENDHESKVFFHYFSRKKDKWQKVFIFDDHYEIESYPRNIRFCQANEVIKRINSMGFPDVETDMLYDALEVPYKYLNDIAK